MPQSDRELILTWWNEAWNEGLWAAAWGKSVEGLTAQQAAWRPPSAPGVTGERRSIWQIVLHLVFWREASLHKLATGEKPSEEEIARGNFPAITDVSEAAWADAKRRFAESHRRIAEILGDESRDIGRLLYLLPHDAYHIGQINTLRAMQGLKPIE
ncbi:MAG TPA: DinB family protein [Phycisphaerales bacterium]|nr:DinB family protein [Phycisphaerales bacterium]